MSENQEFKRGPGRPPKYSPVVVSQVPVTEAKPESESVELLKTLVTAVHTEANNSQGLFRRSSRGYVPAVKKTPENYDLLGEADKQAKRLGHELSQWQRVRPPAYDLNQDVRDFWHAKCMRCGHTASARFFHRLQNDKDSPESPQSPTFMGEAMSMHCNTLMAKAKRNDQQAVFARRVPGAAVVQE